MRSTWKGTLGVLGTISIPVKLYTGTDTPESLSRVCPDCRGAIKNKYECEDCGKDLNFGDWKVGYDNAKEIIPLDPEDVDALKPENNSEITVLGFMPFVEVDPIAMTGNHYFVTIDTPKKKKRQRLASNEPSVAQLSYIVLREMLARNGFVAIGKYVDRDKLHYCCIRPYHSGMLLTKMVFSEYLRDSSPLFAPTEGIGIQESDVTRMAQMVSSLPPIDTTEFEDEYAGRLADLAAKTSVKLRTKGGAVKRVPTQVVAPPVEANAPQMVSIFSMADAVTNEEENPVEAETTTELRERPKQTGFGQFFGD